MSISDFSAKLTMIIRDIQKSLQHIRTNQKKINRVLRDAHVLDRSLEEARIETWGFDVNHIIKEIVRVFIRESHLDDAYDELIELVDDVTEYVDKDRVMSDEEVVAMRMMCKDLANCESLMRQAWMVTDVNQLVANVANVVQLLSEIQRYQNHLICTVEVKEDGN
ncbi:hypothetical protein C1X05_00415 [Laceyella sacchari]|uniref:Uncharacterized protein n=2 Tax=Laceyella TaxID=292635 RepID=A0AA45WRZ2_9BACL|nr:MULTISPECIES: hypothetical protein [Laceyella]AUS07471.1 hypothetical protein C1X05_00415 [Laceyella sacchari]PRZ16675.1 hypothetical protein CLV36_102389 [Laceyella sediminis]SMP32837.1 hypothetical protein SAMN06265361_10953 [Laceyella tengchongensis]